MTNSVSLPKELLRELREHIDRVEEILATLEEMADREGIERIKKSVEEYRRGEITLAENQEKIRKILRRKE